MTFDEIERLRRLLGARGAGPVIILTGDTSITSPIQVQLLEEEIDMNLMLVKGTNIRIDEPKEDEPPGPKSKVPKFVQDINARERKKRWR